MRQPARQDNVDFFGELYVRRSQPNRGIASARQTGGAFGFLFLINGNAYWTIPRMSNGLTPMSPAF
jgi:hypothetical protein